MIKSSNFGIIFLKELVWFLLFFLTTIHLFSKRYFLIIARLGAIMELENKNVTASAFDENASSSAFTVDESEEQEILIDDSLELARKSREMSEEEWQTFVAGLAQNNKKVIPVVALGSNQLLVNEILQSLSQLGDEVLLKRDEAVKQSQAIKAKVAQLVESGKVHINQDEYHKSEESVIQYAGLLENIVNEITGEIAFFGLFASDKSPKHVVVWKEDPEDFVEFIKAKVRFIKKYIKSIRKDLNISFSRYNFGFQAQIKRILQVEAYIRYHDSLRAQDFKASEQEISGQN